MKQVIDGKTYNTGTAHICHAWQHETMEIPSWYCALCITKKGNFFLHYEFSDERYPIIRPLSLDEARHEMRKEFVFTDVVTRQSPNDIPYYKTLGVWDRSVTSDEFFAKKNEIK